MSPEPFAAIPECAECGDRWLRADERRWRAFLTVDNELALYCPACAEREFGDRPAATRT